jgi:ribonuclease J
VNQNKRAIKGIFIGTPSYERFGALEFFYQFIANIPIYTSDVGGVILRTYFDKRARSHNNAPLKLNIKVLEPMRAERIGACSVTPFKISNSMPRSLGFTFTTPEGSIIYIDDFIVSSNKNISFEDEIYQINKITNNRNLMLIVGMGQVGKSVGFTNPNHRISSYFENILIDAPGRVIVGCYDDDVYKILALAQVAASKNRPINIFSNTFVELFNFLREKQYFSTRTINVIDDQQIDQSNNAVVIVTGTPHRLFTKLGKIILDDDPKLHLKDSDTFIFAEATIAGHEKFEADMFDNINRTSVQGVYKLKREIIPVSASNEDHKFLVEMLKPKYIIPVSGLYMNFIDYQKAVVQTGYPRSSIILLDNGQCLSLNNGSIDNVHKIVKLEPQYIGTQGVLDVGASSMFEREQMKENGVILLSLLISKPKKVIEKFNYDVVGVTNLSEENKNIIMNINDECNKLINNLIDEAISKNQLDIKTLKGLIRKIVDKQYEKKFNKKPLVLTTIVFNKDRNQNHAPTNESGQ